MLSKASEVVKLMRELTDHVMKILQKWQVDQARFERQIPEASVKGFQMPWSEEINTLAVNKLKELGFKGTIQSEESGLEVIGEEDDLIYLDPIDGSRNAARRLPYYSFSAGWYKNSEPFVGYVRNLANMDEFLYADGKCLFNGKRIKKPIIRPPNECGVMVERPQSFKNILPILDQLRKKVRFFRIMGATSLDMAYVASGFMDAMVDLDRGVWMSDIGGARIFLDAMGGIVTDLPGKPLPIHTEPGVTPRIIASTHPEIHDVLLDVFDDWIVWILAS